MQFFKDLNTTTSATMSALTTTAKMTNELASAGYDLATRAALETRQMVLESLLEYTESTISAEAKRNFLLTGDRDELLKAGLQPIPEQSTTDQQSATTEQQERTETNNDI